ncbi:hypothetical protein NM688_g1297 [Phlebia brevispora]|uniref:Uncharacterized protein n=1 Tax=Phlebia brevispora TaxID=194682 RepID=A0ACC1TBK2_9APHY|nr:hypothetical protein NM688_g1297 [Phlebia brevispora]
MDDMSDRQRKESFSPLHAHPISELPGTAMPLNQAGLSSLSTANGPLPRTTTSSTSSEWGGTYGHMPHTQPQLASREEAAGTSQRVSGSQVSRRLTVDSGWSSSLSSLRPYTNSPTYVLGTGSVSSRSDMRYVMEHSPRGSILPSPTRVPWRALEEEDESDAIPPALQDSSSKSLVNTNNLDTTTPLPPLGKSAATISGKHALKLLVVRNKLLNSVASRTAQTLNSPQFNQLVQASQTSKDQFDYWVEYFNRNETGKQYIDAMLCTMQAMLDELSPDTSDGTLQELRRMLLDLSQATEVVPNSLFLQYVEPEIKNPVRSGAFTTIYRGMLQNRHVALKLFRLFEVADEKQFWKNVTREANAGASRDGTILSVDPDLKYSWIIQVAEGLVYLHENNVANIMLDENHCVKLADYDFAHLEPGVVRPGAARWAAPEVLRCSEVTPAGDVYSFGSVCLEITTQALPFSEIRKDAQLVFRMGQGGLRPKWKETGNTRLDEIGKVAAHAWAEEPSQRPSMLTIRDILVSLGPLKSAAHSQVGSD